MQLGTPTLCRETHRLELVFTALSKAHSLVCLRVCLSVCLSVFYLSARSVCLPDLSVCPICLSARSVCLPGLSVCLSSSLSARSVCLSSICLSVFCLSVRRLSVCLSVFYLSVRPSVCLSVCPVCLSICLLPFSH